MHHASRCFVLGFLAVSSLIGQMRIPPGASIGNLGTMYNSQPPPGPPPGTGQCPERQVPIFLSGTVMMEGGAGPAADVAIQRVCAGAPRTVAFTNGKGHFDFQWGSMTGVVPEAAESGLGNGMRAADDPGGNDTRTGAMGGGLSGQNMQGCELMAGAPGFRPARLDLTNHRSSDNPDLGLIVLHHIAGVTGSSVSVTALNAPKDARKNWEKGVEFLRKSKVAEAEKELEKAVGIYPKYANA